MWQWIIIGGVSALAGAVFMGGDDPPIQIRQPQPRHVVVAQPNASLENLSGAMYWIGGCSVACSLIGGSTLIYLTSQKRKGGCRESRR